MNSHFGWKDKMAAGAFGRAKRRLPLIKAPEEI